MMASTNARRLGVLAVTTALLLAAGCGGSDDETSGTTRLGELGVLGGDDLGGLGVGGREVAPGRQPVRGQHQERGRRRLGRDEDARRRPQDAGKPDTEDGQQAKDLLDQLAEEIDEGVEAIEDAVNDVQGGTGIVAAITTIGSTFATMSSEVGGIVDQLEQLDPGTELDGRVQERRRVREPPLRRVSRGVGDGARGE